eukprot:2337900-Alexandrium_andersonii.AAC.1
MPHRPFKPTCAHCNLPDSRPMLQTRTSTRVWQTTVDKPCEGGGKASTQAFKQISRHGGRQTNRNTLADALADMGQRRQRQGTHERTRINKRRCWCNR